MYGEDSDLCLRADRLGAKPMVSPEATIIHYGGASEKVRADKMVRLFVAYAQLIRMHWNVFLIKPGLVLLALWPFVRILILTMMSAIGNNKKVQDEKKYMGFCLATATTMVEINLNCDTSNNMAINFFLEKT